MDFGLGLVLTFTDRASAGLAGVTTTLRDLESSVTGSSSQLDMLGNSLTALTSLGGGLTKAITMPIVSFMGLISKFGVGRASFVENMHLAFTSLIGDAQQASDYMQELMGFAKTTPYTYESIAESAQALIAYGFEQNKILTKTKDGYDGVVKVLGDWAGAVGKGEAGFVTVAEILGKIRSEGKVTAIRINQLQRQGIMASKIIGNMYGVAESNARAFISTMSGTQFIDDLLKGLKEGTDGVNGITGAVDGLMSQMKKTWTGALDTFKSSLKTAGLNLMGAYEDEFGVTRYKFLENMTASLNNLSDAVKKSSGVFQPLVDMFSIVINKGSLFIKAMADTWDSMYVVSKDGTKSMSSLQTLIAKVVSGLTLAGPVLLIIGKVGGGLVKSIVIIKKTLKTLLPFLTSFGLALALLAVAWKSDFAGMRTSLTTFTNGIISAFITARNALTGDVAKMTEALAPFKAKTDFFSGLTIAISRLLILITALKEGWDDFTLSEDTFLKAKELGILPLIEAIFDFKYRFDLFKAGFKKGWNEVSNSVKTALSKIAEKVDGTIFEDLLNKVTGFFQKLSDNDPEAWESLGEFFGKLAAKALLLGSAILVVRSVVKKVIKVFTVFRTILSGVINIFTRIKSIAGKISGVFSLITGAVGRAISDVIGFFQLVSEYGLSETMEGLFGTAGATIAGIVSTIGGAILAVVNFVDQWKNGFDTVKAILMTLGIALATVGAIILGAPALIAGIIGGIIALISNLVIVAHDNWDVIKEFWLGVWDKIKTFFSNIGEHIKTFFTETIPNAWNSLVTWVQEIPEKVSTFIGGIKDKLHTFFTETVPYYIGFGIGYVTKGIVNFFTQTIPNAWNSFISAWNNFWNVTFPSVLNSIGQFFINCGQKFVNFFTQTIPNLWNNFVSAWNNFWSVTFPSVLNSIGQFFINAGQKVVNFFTQTIPNAWNSFKTKWVNFWTVTFPSVLNSIGQFFINLKQKFITWGKNLIQGLKQGIQNAWTGLINSIKTWVSSFTQGFKDGWDIHSPSGVFSDIGGNLMQGLLNGVSGMFGKVTDKFSGLSDKVKGTFNGLKDKAGDIWGKMKDKVSGISDNIKSTVTTSWDKIKSGISGKVNEVKTSVTDIWGDVKKVSTELLDKAKSTIFDKWSAIKNIFSDSKQFFNDRFSEAFKGIRDSFEGIDSFFEDLWGKIKDKFSDIGVKFGDILRDTFRGTMNGVFDQLENNINSVIGTVNSMLQPLSDVTGQSYYYVGDLHLPRFAEGGVISKPTTAIVGENGREAVVPLERNTQWIDGLASQLEDRLITSRLKPVNLSGNSAAPTVGNSTYMTTNNNSKGITYEGNTDNSVVFNSGAIQINCANASEEEATRLANRIISIIKRKEQLDKMARYIPVY